MFVGELTPTSSTSDRSWSPRSTRTNLRSCASSAAYIPSKSGFERGWRWRTISTNLGHSIAACWNVHTQTHCRSGNATQRAPVFQSPFECHGQDPRITRKPINPFSLRRGPLHTSRIRIESLRFNFETKGSEKTRQYSYSKLKDHKEAACSHLRQPAAQP